MKISFFYIFIIALFFNTGIQAQSCFLQPSCSGDPNPEVTLTAAVLGDVSVCGASTPLHIEIHNGFPPGIQVIRFPCYLEIELPDDVKYDGGTIVRPSNAAICSNTNENYVGIQLPPTYWVDPGETLTFEIPLTGDCSLLEGFLNGNNSSFPLSSISIKTCYTTKAEPINYCMGKSLEVRPKYSVMTPGSCNSTPTVAVGVPFDMPPLPVEVMGDDCSRTSFEVSVNFSAPVSISTPNSSAVFMTNGNSYTGSIVLVNSTSVLIGFNNVPGLCSDNYPGGLFEDGSIQLNGLVVSGCISGGVAVEYGINVCSGPAQNQCPSIIPQYTSTCNFIISTVAPKMNITRSVLSGALDFCPPSSSIDGRLQYEVLNTSQEEVARGIVFTFDVWSSIVIHNFRLGNSTTNYTPANFESLLNQVYSSQNPGEKAFQVTDKQVIINTNYIVNNPSLILPLQDLNGDGVFSELLLGEALLFQPALASSCPFKGTCLSTINEEDLRANVTYTDQCQSNNFSDSDAHRVQLEGPPAQFETPFPGPVIADGETFTLKFCIDEWDSWSGTDSPYNLGDFRQFLNVEFEYPGLTLLDLTYPTASNPININSTMDQSNIDLGIVSDPPLSGCFELRFSFTCDPGTLTELIDISVTAFGQWVDCGADCSIYLGCDNIALYPDLICQAGDGTPAECGFVQTDRVAIRRSIAGDNSTPLEAAYACDETTVIMGGTLTTNALQSFNGKIYPCFIVPTAYEGVVGPLTGNDLFVTPITPPGSGPNVELHFSGTSSTTIFGVPHTVYLFESDQFFVPTNSVYDIFINISFEVDQAFTLGLEDKVTDIPFIAFLGERAPDDTIVKCLETGHQWYQIFKVENEVPELSVAVGECDQYFNVPFQLNYVGGTDGTDFSVARPINRIIRGFTAEVINTSFFEATGIVVNGQFHPFPFEDIATILPPPTPKDGCEGNSQEFHIRVAFSGDCTTPSHNVYLLCTYNLESLSCNTTEEDLTVIHTIEYTSGSVVTNPLLANIEVEENCVELTAQTTVTVNSAEFIVHQFEFNPQEVSISHIGTAADVHIVNISATEALFVVTVSGNFKVGDVINQSVQVCFLEACEPDPYSIQYWAGQSCGVEQARNMRSTNATDCLQGGLFNIEFVNSDLKMKAAQCSNGVPDEYCDNASIVATLHNYTQGDVVRPGFVVSDLPDGMYVAAAYYLYPDPSYSVLSPCETAGMVALNPAELDALVNGGFVIPATALDYTNPTYPNPNGSFPGIASGAGEIDRSLRMILEVGLICGTDPSTVKRELILTGFWEDNCGEADSESRTIAVEGWDNMYGLDLALSKGPLSTDCADDANSGSFDLYTNPAGTDTDLYIDQTVTICFTISPSIQLISPVLDNSGCITYTNVLPGIIPVQFEVTECETFITNCDSDITVTMTSQKEVFCPYGEILGHCFTFLGRYTGLHVPLVNLRIRDVSLLNACDDIIGNEEVSVVGWNNCVSPNTPLYVIAYHDTDCDGIPDDILGYTIIIAEEPDPNDLISATIPVDISSLLQSGEEVCIMGAIATNLEIGCICSNLHGYSFDSTCQDWELSYNSLPNGIEFQITPVVLSPVTSTGDFICVNYEVNGQQFSWNDPTFIHPGHLPYGELCMEVQSTRCAIEGDLPNCNGSSLCTEVICVDYYPEQRSSNANEEELKGLETAVLSSTVFPNPTSTSFIFSLNGHPALNGHMTITDINGKEIYTQKVAKAEGESREYQLSVNDWPTGVYLLLVEGGERLIYHKIVVE